MSQTPSILLERDKSHSNQMLAQRLRSASAVLLELTGIRDGDAVFDVPPVVVEAQHPLESHGSFCNVVRRYVPMCPRGWISSPPSAAALQVDGRRTLVGVEDYSKTGVQASCVQPQRRLRRV